MPCIFCGTDDELTREHVFPAFCGANLELQDGSCRTHNKQCGDFEDAFARDTRTLRNVFEIVDRYGNVPSSLVSINIEEITLPNAIRRGSGDIQLRDYVASVPQQDGKLIRHGFFVTEANAKAFIEGAQKRGERADEVSFPSEVLITPYSQQTIGFAFTDDARRVASKAALASLAYLFGFEFVMNKQFDELRKAILREDRPFARVFANDEFANALIRTPHQHSVVVYLSAGMHTGWALVTLFGGISYVVHLTDCFHERESRSASLYYDAERREVFRPVVLFNEYEMVGRVLSPDTQFENVLALDGQWFPIIERACHSKGFDIERLRADVTSTESRGTAE